MGKNKTGRYIQRSRYTLYAVDRKKNERTPIKLKENNKLKEKVDLTVIDRFTMEHANSPEELTQYLNQQGYHLPKKTIYVISYKTNGQNRDLEVIYDDVILNYFTELCDGVRKEYYMYVADHPELSKEEALKLRLGLYQSLKEDSGWKAFFQKFLQNLNNGTYWSKLKDSPYIDRYMKDTIHDYIYNQYGGKQEELDTYQIALQKLEEAFVRYKPIRGIHLFNKKYIRDMERYRTSDIEVVETKELETEYLYRMGLLNQEDVVVFKSIEPEEIETEYAHPLDGDHQNYPVYNFDDKKESFEKTLKPKVSKPRKR